MKSGHALNHALMMALYADPEAWKFVTIPRLESPYAQDSVSA